ncbi:Na(+)/H(+) antiporter subunit B [Candidatus Mesenet endosymbiont of Phosphuga atrata]|uniref:Na(+)/H(+) antiporter subunit B n=1 Tax=Candidatus Mesenet endosymbiont of Phosphuga atrata TaxID=3066221 RepID=UPI0030D12894
MIKSPILQAIAALIIPFIVLFGLYVQFHGDFSPGGGFQAGIIIASGVIFHAMLFGPAATLKAIPYSFIRILSGMGVLIYMGTGIITMLLGAEFLSYNVLFTDNLTAQKIGIFTVELGVGLTVCSAMLIIYFSFAVRSRK